MENIISVRNLTKQFGAFRAVDNISFDVAQGEIFGFLGANGAGKTTAIRILCGLSRATSGTGSVAASTRWPPCRRRCSSETRRRPVMIRTIPT